MKKAILTLLYTIITLTTVAQESIKITRGQLLKFRKGFIISNHNDSLFGLIWHSDDNVIYFIDKTTKIEFTTFGQPSTLTYYSAGNGYIQSFNRNNLTYVVKCIPPDNKAVFLTVLAKGKMNLFCLLYNYADARQANSTVGSLASLGDNTDKTEEYYDLKAYYIQKSDTGKMFFIPSGEKKFRDVLIPLVRDNKKFLEEVRSYSIDYYHIGELVRLYNSTADGSR